MNKRETLKLPEQADAAFEKVCEAVIERARITGTPVVIWRDGKVCEITPDEAAREAGLLPPDRGRDVSDAAQ